MSQREVYLIHLYTLWTGITTSAKCTLVTGSLQECLRVCRVETQMRQFQESITQYECITTSRWSNWKLQWMMPVYNWSESDKFENTAEYLREYWVHLWAFGGAGYKSGSAGGKPGSAHNMSGNTNDKPAITNDKPAFTDNKPASTDDKPWGTDDKPGSTPHRPGSIWEHLESLKSRLGKHYLLWDWCWCAWIS